MAGGNDRDVTGESSSAAGFLDDVAGVVGGLKMHPAETNAAGFSGVVEPYLFLELGGVNINGLGSGVLCGDGGRAGAGKVFQPDGHIGWSGVESGAALGGLCNGAGFGVG